MSKQTDIFFVLMGLIIINFKNHLFRLRGEAAEIGGGLNSNGTKRRGKSPTDNLECLSDDDNEMDENNEDFNTVVRVPLRDRIALLFSRIFASIGMYRSDPISGKMSHENTQGKAFYYML